jgi:hypothetical protein
MALRARCASAKGTETRDFSRPVGLARRLHIADGETRNPQIGENAMLKNLVIALGIAAITSSSAFAATKAPKSTHATHKVAQATETKPAEGKAKLGKQAKQDKQDKKMKKEIKAVEPAAAQPAKK